MTTKLRPQPETLTCPICGRSYFKYPNPNATTCGSYYCLKSLARKRGQK